MIQTIRVTSSSDGDPLGEDLRAEIRRSLGLAGIAHVRTAKVYRLEGLADAAQAVQLARQLLAEEIDQRWSLDEPLITDADALVEVAYKPGVMNPEAASLLKAAQDLGLPLAAADASREYAFYGILAPGDLERILARLLVNPTIERVVTEAPISLVMGGEPGPTAVIPLCAMDDAAMQALSAAGLYLDLVEMRAIQDYFVELGRDPTDLELEVLAQTWSEHCVHKTFKADLLIDGRPKPPLMRRLKEATARHDALVVSAFVDNSGVLAFYDGWAVAGKVETHNSPSAIEPYGGAMTGSGGVFRDILGTGLGARVIASTDMFCFAPPDLPAEQVPPGCLAPDYLLRRVVAGVRDYGNRMGVPTNNGSVHFHPDFRAKPTVIVGAYGLLPEAVAQKARPRSGDRILVMGGRTGRDGIHGATFSSAEMTAQTLTVNSQAVQIGNAVEEKRTLDALLACRDAGLIQALTDCGAGGFSSAIGELGEELGVTVELERAPLKYPGLAPWEVFLSESQERMVLAVGPEQVAAVARICAVYNVEVTDLGCFEATGRLTVRHEGATVGELQMAFLHGGYPRRTLTGVYQPRVADDRLPTEPADEAAWRAAALAVMGHPNVASKEPICRQYDHTVQGMAAMGPFGGPLARTPGDAAILTPLLGKPYGLVIAHGLNPVLCALDPYWGGLWAGAEAMANLVAVGGNPREVGLIDNFIWPVPDAASLADLDRAVDACVDLSDALERPFISGKDSLSSTYRFPDGTVLKIPPVLCVSVFGRIPDVAKTVGGEFTRAGATLVLVGARDLDPASGYGLGGSTWLDTQGLAGRLPPRVDLALLPRVLDAVHAAIVSGGIVACHDLSEGGLLAAAAEMGIGAGLGAELELGGDRLLPPAGGGWEGGPAVGAELYGEAGAVGARRAIRRDATLFNESAGVFLAELADGADAAALFGDLPHLVIGRTLAEPELRVRDGEGAPLFTVGLDELREAWERPMRAVFH